MRTMQTNGLAITHLRFQRAARVANINWNKTSVSYRKGRFYGLQNIDRIARFHKALLSLVANIIPIKCNYNAKGVRMIMSKVTDSVLLRLYRNAASLNNRSDDWRQADVKDGHLYNCKSAQEISACVNKCNDCDLFHQDFATMLVIRIYGCLQAVGCCLSLHRHSPR